MTVAPRPGARRNWAKLSSPATTWAANGTSQRMKVSKASGPFIALSVWHSISFVATLHVANLFECCGLPLEFVLPPCDDGSTTPFGDLAGDGVVGGSDLGLLFANWGGSGVGDLDGNGVVDAADLGLLLTVFGG